MTNDLAVSYDEFKRIAADFMKAAPTAPDLASLDNGYKCASLAYLNVQYGNTALDRHNEAVQAPIVLKLCTKAFLARESELQQMEHA